MAVQDGGYKKGGFWRIDARSGAKVRGYNTRREWTGNFIANADWEARHPQDFVRGLRDKQIVENPRPPPDVDTFIGPLVTELTVAARAGDTAASVISTARMQAGDRIAIPLDNGNLFQTTIVSASSPTVLTLHAAFPFSASVGNVVTDYSAVAAATL